MDIRFGWKKDKFDKRDYLHRRRVIKLPEEVYLDNLLTNVRNQGKVGSCVGFGIGINLNSVKKALGIYQEWCSPTYIYNGARYLEGTLPFDFGCNPRDALEWTTDYGILLEHYWPYNPEALDKSAPSSTRISQADRYKGFAYFRVVDSIDGICDALAAGHFVSIGSPWFGEWMDVPTGVLPVPTVDSDVVGGHETCIYGYNRSLARFYGVNSWGENWGSAGSYSMPFEAIEVFKQQGGYDAHYLTFTEEIEDEPPPEPTPSPCPIGNGVAAILNRFNAIRGGKGRFYYKNP